MSCSNCKAIRRRVFIAAAFAAAFVDRALATLPEGMKPGPYADWFKSLVDGNGYSCCDSSEGHRLAKGLPPGAEPTEDSWRYFQGKQPFTNDPKDPDFVRAEFFKYGEWRPITQKMMNVRDKRDNKPADENNPTGHVLIWYSDYPPRTEGGHGSVNIFCFIPPMEF